MPFTPTIVSQFYKLITLLLWNLPHHIHYVPCNSLRPYISWKKTNCSLGGFNHMSALISNTAVWENHGVSSPTHLWIVYVDTLWKYEANWNLRKHGFPIALLSDIQYLEHSLKCMHNWISLLINYSFLFWYTTKYLWWS